MSHTPVCPLGLEEYIFKIDGVDLTCHIEYEPAERGSRENGIQMEPDYPESISIEAIYAGGSMDIQALLSDAILEEIEAHLRHEMESTNDYDY